MALDPKKDALLIFTRNPELGKVKTRLAKGIGEVNALEVYKKLLQHTHDQIHTLGVTKRVGYSDRLGIDDLWDASVFEKFVQEGGDLGERMQRAFEQAFLENFQKVIIIGSDLYDLKNSHLEQAFEALDHSDAVIGPALDGGYYLLGLRQPIPNIFKNKTWGSVSVLRDTRKDLKEYTVRYLEPLNDIDYAKDLAVYPEFASYFNQPTNAIN